MIDIKFKMKLYPITENGEEIYTGGFLDVAKIDFVQGTVYTFQDYANPETGLLQVIFKKRLIDEWHLWDNKDERDEPTELWASINGNKFKQVNFTKEVEDEH